MMEMMDIVVPIQGFGRHGGYRVLSRLGTEWGRAGHRVRILSPAYSAPVHFPTEAEILWFDDRGIGVEHAPGTEGLASLVRPLHAMYRALSLHARDADLLVANQNQTAWPVALARSRAKRGYYIQAYEPDFFADMKGRGGVALRGIARGSYRLPLRQVVNSPVYFSYPGIRAKSWVPPGVDLSVFRPIPREAGRPPVMGCIGRREAWKGTADVIEAFRRLRASGAGLRLRVAFEIPGGTRLPEGAEMVQPQNDAELADFYRSLDVQVAPGTIQLGAPHYPVIEAMACGVPVVTTGYLPATPDSAWIVPVHDPDAIASAVVDVLGNPSEARRRAALATEAVRPYAWEVVADRLLHALSR